MARLRTAHQWEQRDPNKEPANLDQRPALGFGFLGFGLWVLVFGLVSLVFGFLGFGLWALVFGLWSVVWSLVFGLWALVWLGFGLMSMYAHTYLCMCRDTCVHILHI